MRAIRCSSQRVDFDFSEEKHATAAEVFEGNKMEPSSGARGRQLTHNCQNRQLWANSAVSAARCEKTHPSQKRLVWGTHSINPARLNSLRESQKDRFLAG